MKEKHPFIDFNVFISILSLSLSGLVPLHHEARAEGSGGLGPEKAGHR